MNRPRNYLLVLMIFLVFGSGCAFNKYLKLSPTEMFELAEYRMNHKKFIKARKLFTTLRETYPETPESHMAQLRIADAYYLTKSYDSAAIEYQAFTDFHPASKWAPYAQFRLGICKVHNAPTIDRDQKVTTEGIEAFHKLIMLYPDSPEAKDAAPKLAELERQIVEHHQYVADFYYKRRAWKAANLRYAEVIADTKDADLKINALYKQGLCSFHAHRYEDARTQLTNVLPEIKAEKVRQELLDVLSHIPPTTPTPIPSPTPPAPQPSPADAAASSPPNS